MFLDNCLKCSEKLEPSYNNEVDFHDLKMKGPGYTLLMQLL